MKKSIKSSEPSKKKVEKTNTNGQHIMISYDHEHKRQVHKLADELQNMGYKIWIDRDDMRMWCSVELETHKI